MKHPEFNFDAPPKKSAAEVSAAVLDKIKKLLRLSESSNPHEAELAMKRAMDLADQVNLDLSSLDTDEEVEAIIYRWIKTGKRLSREQRLALNIVLNYFNVSPCHHGSRGTTLFVGKERDIAIAEYVMAFLTGSCRRYLKAWEKSEKEQRRKTTTGKRANYITGYFWGVSRQLRGRREQLFLEHDKFAIVLADQAAARDEVLDELAPNSKPIKFKDPRTNRSAQHQGYLDGRDTKINAGLGSGGGKLLLQ